MDHTEYWEEVDAERFNAKFKELFPLGSRTNVPKIQLGNKSIIIHKDGEIYDDFKIEFGEDTSHFYLHNYCFWG